MYSFRTSTGTVYTLRNGRVQRQAMFGQLDDLTDWPCVRLATPVYIGDCVKMYVHGRGWYLTTPVVEWIAGE